MSRRRLIFVVGALVVATAATAAAVAWARPSAEGRDAVRTTSSSAVGAASAGTRALRVLHGWDARRAHAWRDGSRAEVRALYAPRSPASRQDLAMLDAYRERGLRVVGMRRQTTAVQVLARAPRLLTLRVTDRLARAVAVGTHLRERLPTGGWTTQTLTFRRTAAGWVLGGTPVRRARSR